MDETRCESGGPPDSQRSAVRRYTLSLYRRIDRAVYERTVRCNADADGLFADAERLAENGLPLLEDCCERRLSAGWAARFIDTITLLRRGGGDQTPGVLAAWAVEYFDTALVALEVALPPEERMPLDLVFTAGVGLRLQPGRAHPCRVRVPARRAGGVDHVVVVVDGDEVVLKGQHRFAFRTALEKMSAALDSGRVGVAFEEMKNYQGAISYFRNHDKSRDWKRLISTPRDHDRACEKGLYSIRPAQTASQLS